MGDLDQIAEEFQAIMDLFNEDAQKCIGSLDLTEEDDIEAKVFWRRMLARATFAFIDSVVHHLTIMGYAGHSGRIGKSSPEEVEKFYDLCGGLKPTSGRTPFPEALEFAFCAYAKGYDSDYVLPKDEWEVIERLDELRERLEFPETVAGLQFTEEDVQIILKSMKWLITRMDELLATCPLDTVLTFRGGRPNDPSTS